jgi:ABC-type amino acid transport substrate-binding protein
MHAVKEISHMFSNNRTSSPLGGRRKWLSLLAAMLLVTATACSSSSATPAPSGLLAQVKAAGHLKVGLAVDPPFTLRDSGGRWYSFEPDLLDLLGQELGVTIDIVPTGWTTIAAGLQSGQYDMIGASISDTAEREKVMDFSVPYSYGGTTFFVIKGGSKTLSTVADLNNSSVTISFQTGGAQDTVTRAQCPNATLRALPNISNADLVSELSANRADAVALPSFLDAALMQKYPNFQPIPTDLKGISPTGIAWSVNKGHQDFVDALNKFIQKEQANGTIDKLIQEDLTIANSLG